MQTPMFVFIGLRENKTEQDIDILFEKLQQTFDDQNQLITFVKKDELISARFDDVSYYLTIIKDKREMKDFNQMAEDFELDGSKKPINKAEFTEANNRKKARNPNLYQARHYLVGQQVFDTLNNFCDIKIYFYQ